MVGVFSSILVLTVLLYFGPLFASLPNVSHVYAEQVMLTHFLHLFYLGVFFVTLTFYTKIMIARRNNVIVTDMTEWQDQEDKFTSLA